MKITDCGWITTNVEQVSSTLDEIYVYSLSKKIALKCKLFEMIGKIWFLFCFIGDWWTLGDIFKIGFTEHVNCFGYLGANRSFYLIIRIYPQNVL